MPESTRLGVTVVACEACDRTGASVTEDERGMYRSMRCQWCDGHGVVTLRQRQLWLDAKDDESPPSGVVAKDNSDDSSTRKTVRPAS